MNKQTELARPIKVKAIPAEPVVVEARENERADLAARFDLPGIDSLRAEVHLTKTPSAVRAQGTLTAAIRQSCAISGEEFPTTIDETLDLKFIEETALDEAQDDDAGIEIELDADDCDEIEYSGDTFDLGEAVAQTLGLAIDPYAEGPNADDARKQAGIVGDGEKEGPLAEALRGLKGD